MPEESDMETREFNAPYIPFRTLLNLFERLAQEGVPNRIDRTYLDYLSGITQTYLIAALKTFDLVDDDGVPTPKLREFVENPDQRPALTGQLVREYYADALSLGEGATHGELEEVFREKYGLRGDTNRKGITFFLNAATFGNVPVSRHYKMPRATGGDAKTTVRRTTRRRTVRRTPQGGGQDPQESGTTIEAQRARYIDMLMKRAEAQDELDDNLLDRIEALLGYDAEPAPEEDGEPE
jgi:hypothetical protein